MTIPDWLRPVFARVVASAVAALLAYLTRKGIDIGLSDVDVARFSEGVTAITWAVMLAVYAAVHRAISAKTNPTDSASPSIAVAATGPMGAGERTTLGARLDEASKSVPQPTRPDNVVIPRPDFARQAPPAYEPLIAKVDAPTPVEILQPFAPPALTPAPPTEKRAPRERRKRPPKVTVQEPGAPQPPTEHAETAEGFEP